MNEKNIVKLKRYQKKYIFYDHQYLFLNQTIYQSLQGK